MANTFKLRVDVSESDILDNYLSMSLSQILRPEVHDERYIPSQPTSTESVQ